MPAPASSTARTRAKRRWPRSCSDSPRPRPSCCPGLGRGEAIWKVGQRSFFVSHLISAREARLVDTDAAMAGRPQRGRGTVSARPATQGQTWLAEAAGFVALTALVGGLGCLWLWGGLAGLLFGDGWPRGLTLADHARVAFTLPSHLGDPASRMARAGARRPPLRARVLRRPRRDPGRGGGAHRRALVASARRRGTVAGARTRRRGRRVGRARATSDAWPCEHPPRGAWCWAGSPVAWSPPSSATRSSSSPPPNRARRPASRCPPSLNGKGPVLACSVKTDLLRDTLARRARLGEVKVFDPTAITGFPRAGWSPLGASHTWQAASETADRLVASAQPAHGSGEASFWNQAGARYLAPLLFAAASTHRTMVDVVRWVDTDDQEQITNALGGELWEQPRTPDARDERAALETLDGIWRSDDRLRSSLVMTAALALKAYADPTVQECSREGELTADWLLDGSANTAYLSATVTDQARLRPLFVTLIDEITSEVYARSARTGQPIDPPLLVVLDEAANIAPLPDLDQLASTGAGQGHAARHRRPGPRANARTLAPAGRDDPQQPPRQNHRRRDLLPHHPAPRHPHPRRPRDPPDLDLHQLGRARPPRHHRVLHLARPGARQRPARRPHPGPPCSSTTTCRPPPCDCGPGTPTATSNSSPPQAR